MVKIKSTPKKHVDKKRWGAAYGPIAVFMAKDNKKMTEENLKLEQKILLYQDSINAMNVDIMMMEENNELMHTELITSNIALAETRGSLEQMQILTRQLIQELKKREVHSRMQSEKIRNLKRLVPNVTDRTPSGLPRLTPTSMYENRYDVIMDVGWLAADEEELE